MSANVVLWGPSDFLARIHDVIEVYGEAWGAPSARRADQRAISSRHATYPAFACAAALEGDALVGFGYGTRGEPTHWWHERVAPAAPPAWFEDYFVIAEVAVRPEAQGRGIGRAVTERLLATEEANATRAVLLTVDAANERAIALYRSLGFEDVVAEFRFEPEGPPKLVLGRRR
jgi:ribosomal protein S18 acetylase RimI-like enzyme